MKRVIVAAAVAVLLAACGGNSGKTEVLRTKKADAQQSTTTTSSTSTTSTTAPPLTPMDANMTYCSDLGDLAGPNVDDAAAASIGQKLEADEPAVTDPQLVPLIADRSSPRCRRTSGTAPGRRSLR